MRIAVVGGGWAGCAAAVEAADAGAWVTLFEATPTLGGRARALPWPGPDGQQLTLDNGQHILIGAYTETLALMQRVGLPLLDALWALPLALPFPDGTGLQTPAWAARWPAPLDALAAIAQAPGWGWRDKAALLRRCLRWQMRGFRAADDQTVAQLCAGLPARILSEMIEPLCVSALNLPTHRASAQVFLRVLQDALTGPGFGAWRPSSLLLPRRDLTALWPQAAADWLQTQHPLRTTVRLGARVQRMQPLTTGATPPGWRLQGTQQGEPFDETFDAIIWATSAPVAAQAVQAVADAANAAPDCAPVRTDRAADSAAHSPQALRDWARTAAALPFTAITTVYAHAPGFALPQPMLALRAEPDAARAPAQFVFDRGRLHAHEPGSQGVLAFVISASEGERDALERRVIDQALRQLGPLGLHTLNPLQTVVEKRATFACLPGLQRPTTRIAPGLWAAGDYIEGPYPATLESAVRSGLAAARDLLTQHADPAHHRAPDRRPSKAAPGAGPPPIATR